MAGGGISLFRLTSRNRRGVAGPIFLMSFQSLGLAQQIHSSILESSRCQ